MTRKLHVKNDGGDELFVGRVLPEADGDVGDDDIFGNGNVVATGNSQQRRTRRESHVGELA